MSSHFEFYFDRSASVSFPSAIVCMSAALLHHCAASIASARPFHYRPLSIMSASIAQSQPSVSCSLNTSFTPPYPPSSSTTFQLAHSPLFSSHTRARSSHPNYPPRFTVPDDKLDFSVDWSEYRPTHFTAPTTEKHSPDPVDPHHLTADTWHSRPSTYPYILDGTSSRPYNPFGRTGMAGRGKLYYWGPNHAADCILLRQHNSTLQLLVIKRGDTGELALVGGMIDKGERPEQCIKREFGEEVMGVPEEKEKDSQPAAAIAEQQRVLDAIFSPANTRCVYRGVVDDARNTDNAWLETAAFMYELPSSVTVDEVERLFVGGSDASAVMWVECGETGDKLPQLYASHSPLVKLALRLRREGGGGDESGESEADGKQSKM